jgi:hypothetical protein
MYPTVIILYFGSFNPFHYSPLPVPYHLSFLTALNKYGYVLILQKTRNVCVQKNYFNNLMRSLLNSNDDITVPHYSKISDLILTKLSMKLSNNCPETQASKSPVFVTA